MRNPLQEQLLKVGLAKKSKVAEVVREQARLRHAKGAPPPTDDDARVDARRLQAERAERDRALSAQRNAEARLRETRAQVRQIVETQRVKGEGEATYAFEDGGSIRRIVIDPAQRALLARGALVIVRHEDGHALLPRAAADKVIARDPAMVVVDHGGAPSKAAAAADVGDAAPASDDDAYYAQFKVPDDLIW